MLIDPPTALVQMDDRVAQHRGLRRFAAPQSHSAGATAGSAEAAAVDATDQRGGRTHRRRGRVPMQDRREAEASLSHDGDYAVAVCQVFNEAPAGESDGIVDDGTGPPLHEPEYGDWGFCEMPDEDIG